MDGIIEGLAKAAATNFKPKEGDYIKDGLLYCGKCHTPKQCEVEIGGRVIKPKCQEECGKWYDFKLYLDGELPNIHGITLEG